MTNPTVTVSITSDLVCPWCWVGLKNLQEAAKRASVETKITWKPYLLRPNTPEEGSFKGGTPESRVPSRLRSVGESVGIHFTGLTDRTPNTSLFHATILALQTSKEPISESDVTAYHEEVFMGYFTLGIFPDKVGLLSAAKKVENLVVYKEILDLLDDRDRTREMQRQVYKEAAENAAQGISGVPTFAFDDDVPAFSGAQPVEIFMRYLNMYAGGKQEE